jgi:glycosyltransferase involved in cell wall biosynthesis
MPEIQARLGKVVLLVAGEFWEDKRHYLEMMEQLGIDDSVIIDDRYIPNEEIPLYFSAADILLIPYRCKSDSGVAQLARGFEVPYIMTSFGKSHENSREMFALVPPGDGDALAQAIVRFITAGCVNTQGVNASSQDPVVSWKSLVIAIETLGSKYE